MKAGHNNETNWEDNFIKWLQSGAAEIISLNVKKYKRYMVIREEFFNKRDLIIIIWKCSNSNQQENVLERAVCHYLSF